MFLFLASGLVASTKSLFCKTFRSFGINDYCNNYFKIHFKEHNVLNFNIKHLNCLDVTLKLDSIQFKFFQSRSRISKKQVSKLAKFSLIFSWRSELNGHWVQIRALCLSFRPNRCFPGPIRSRTKSINLKTHLRLTFLTFGISIFRFSLK